MIYFPLHIFNIISSLFFPRWLFIKTYSPSCETVRKDEEKIRNATRLIAYKLKKAKENV